MTNLEGLKLNHIYQMDCLEGMKLIPDKSIDMILCDLPYGTTACKWDTIIPFEPLWEQYNRIIKDNGAVVLFGSEPFSTKLRSSNLKNYKYDWVWNKKLAGNGVLAKRQPLKIHENIMIFNTTKYFPQMTKGKMRKKMTGGIKESEITGGKSIVKEYTNDEYYPQSIQEFSIANLRKGRLHPTQKPIALFEYLIKTYTNEGETVLDNCIGSGTTAIAATLNNRNWIGFETEPKYVEIANVRLRKLEAERCGANDNRAHTKTTYTTSHVDREGMDKGLSMRGEDKLPEQDMSVLS